MSKPALRLMTAVDRRNILAGMRAVTSLWTRMERWPAWALDGALALFLAAAEVLHALGEDTLGPAGIVVPLLLLSALPIGLRRRSPLVVLAIIGLATLALELLDVHVTLVGLLLAMYTVAVHSSEQMSRIALVVVMVGGITAVSVQHTPAFILVALAVPGTGWALGTLQRTRAAHAAEVERRLELLERQRDERDRLAAAEERARIARELHDVVAHGLSVMVLQAEAARSLLASESDGADKTMAEIERVGRESLAEMRRLLGVLDVGGEAPSLAPQPGLARIEELVQRFRGADLPVELVIQGDRRELASGVDVSAFRIVQEALTNVLKHAGRVPVTVTLRYQQDAVEVEVVDLGRAAGDEYLPSDGDGRGLVGMRERVALLGGQLSAGAGPDGGFRVACVLPLEQR
jgi:signal transduction histidine kinase